MKTKQYFLRFFASLLLLAVSTVSWAYDFVVNGIYYNISESNATVTYKNNDYKSYSGSVEIPSSVTYGSKTYSVTSIGESAFSGCSGLISITFPNSVKSIGWSAFSGCSNLTSVTIPESVTSIGNSAFSGCSSLTSVTCLAKSVPTMGYYVFSNVPQSSATLYVSKSAVNAYETADQWKEFDKIIGLAINFSDANVKAICVANWDTNGDGELDKDEAAAVTSLGEVLKNNTTITSFDELQYFTGLTTIGEWAFYGCSSLTSITIPNSVTSIGNYAFQNCSSLNSVTIGSGVTSIGDNAFKGCSGLTSITLPNSVTNIHGSAFSGCYGLTSINIPNSVTIIGGAAFYRCTGLKSIKIPNGVTRIYASTFKLCSGLTSVTIGSSVTNIDEDAFFGCNNLTSVTLSSNALVSKSYSGSDITLKKIFGSQVKNYIIGEGVTSIGDYAFMGCSDLTSITIPNSVTSIGNYAFSDCSCLTSVTLSSNALVSKSYSDSDITLKKIFGSQVKNYIIGEGVTSIGNKAFAGCSGLTSVTIPNSVTSIGNLAFYNCSGLKSITIPSSVTSIDLGAFYLCSGLTKAEFASIEHLCNISFNNEYANPLYNAKHLYIGGQEVIDLSIPNSVTSIGNYAFSGCSCLTSITIPNSVTSIGNYAFSGCSRPTSVTIPNGVTSIGNGAFSGCSNLTSVTIPESVTSIGDRAFADCTSLPVEGSLRYADTYLVEAVSIWGQPAYTIKSGTRFIGSNAFDGRTKLTSIDIPESVTSIGRSAFKDCSGLTSVTIPESVTSIGGSAFDNCTKLKSVTIGRSVTSIDISVFYNCSPRSVTLNSNAIVSKKYSSSDHLGTIFGSQVAEYIIGDDVTSIGDYAFYNCSGLTSVTIGNSVTSIGRSAFSGCSNLTSVTIPNSVTSISDHAFYGCSNLRSITIPNSVTFISSWAFTNCSSLKSVTLNSNAIVSKKYSSSDNLGKIFGSQVAKYIIGEDVTSIGDYAFYNCSGLTSVTIGNSVTSIGQYGFDELPHLTTAIIGSGVKIIGKHVFSDCPSLTSVTSLAIRPPMIDNTVFFVVGSLTIYVPKGCYNAYRTAERWKHLGEIIEIKEIINFADANVKAICVANWDTDGDGELDTEEAAAVTSLGQVFMGNTTITSFNELPHFTGLTTMEDNVFNGCSSLKSIIVPDGVTSIGSSAFSGCSGLTAITIPNSVTSIGHYVFSSCSGLTSVTIGNGVSEIGQRTFQGCSNLKSVSIGQSVTKIGLQAFDGCSNIISVTLNSDAVVSNSSMSSIFGLQVAAQLAECIIGNNVTSIGPNAFNGCSGLTSINIPDGVTSIGSNAFNGCSGLTSITIPDGVTIIGSNAFYGCSGLNSINVASGNTKYDSRNNCNAIIETESNTLLKGCKNTVIPKSVTSIGSSAFRDCSGLTSVTIPNSVTSIGNQAFFDCTDLKYLVIDNSVTSIGQTAFGNCTALESIIVAPSNTVYDSRENCNAILETATNTLIAGCKNTLIPNSVTTIGYGAFINCTGITSIAIPNSVTSIDRYAFANCTDLTSITIPNSVTSIGSYAFYGCTDLMSITIPNSVTSIGVLAFSGCSSLTLVTCLAENVPTTGKSVFDGVPQSDATLYVPKSSLNAYKTANQWKNFGTIMITYDIPVATSIALNKQESALEAGAQEQLTATVLPEEAEQAVTWTSSNPTVATVDENGLVTAVASGTATITATTTDGTGLKASCAVTVIKLATSIALNKTETTLEAGAQEQLTATVLPAEAEQAVAWKSSDSTVATVGENGLVTAVSEGTATITATTTDGTDLDATCAVTVTSQRIYIETDVTSQFPIDWQGWSNATGYVGWAAPQVTTNDGRQTPACERFDGSKATTGVIFNRTLTGLTNGTYRIELYGAAASTKSRDTGIDTDMTEADEGDETAVYLYATTASGTVKQNIPVHWALNFNTSGIATATLNDVVVTDGTVEIGMFGEKKFTNWEVIQIKGVTALVDAEEMHANTLTRAQSALDDAAYVNVTGEERTALSQAIADNTTVTEQTAAAYQTAITALDNATNAFTDAKASYDAWAGIKNRKFPYASRAKKAVAESAAAVLPTNAADAVSRAETLLPLYRQYAESSAMLEGVDGATNMTSYINNPKAEEDVEGWTTVLGEGSGGSISIRNDQPWTDGSGSTSHKYFDGGNYGASAWDVTFKQDITLPAGRYQLTAIGRSSQDVALTLFAGDETAEMAHINADGGLFNLGWEQTSVEFELAQSATVSIGVRGVTPAYHNWMSFSDFRLVQFPDNNLAASVALNKTEATLKAGAQEQLTATVLPAEAEQTVTWKSSDPTVATVDENGLVTAVASGTATITATTTDGTNLTATCEVTVEDSAIPGDVNGDGTVNGADIVAEINYVLADNIAGDVNGDGNVNGADIVAVINYVLNYPGGDARETLAQSRAAAAEEPAEILSGTKTEEGISLSLAGGEDCTAFQFMLSLPEGVSLTAVIGSEERLGDHELLFRRQADGRYLVLGFAMDNHCIGESSGELLSLRLEGNANGRATVSEALIFTPQAETRYMNALDIDLPTAVSGVRAKGAATKGDIYDLGGRKLNQKPSNGYYIQGGKTYFVK